MIKPGLIRFALLAPFLVSVTWIGSAHVTQNFGLLAAVSGTLFSAELQIQDAILFFEFFLLSTTFLFSLSSGSIVASLVQLLIALIAVFAWVFKLVMSLLGEFQTVAPLSVFVVSSLLFAVVILAAIYRTKLPRRTIGCSMAGSIIAAIVLAIAKS